MKPEMKVKDPEISKTSLAPKGMRQKEGQIGPPQCKKCGQRRKGCPSRIVVMDVTTIIRPHSPDQKGKQESPDLYLFIFQSTTDDSLWPMTTRS